MRLLFKGLLVGSAAVAGLLAGPAARLSAQESPFAGSWRLLLFSPEQPGSRQPAALIKIEGKGKDGKVAAQVTSTVLRDFANAAVDGNTAQADDKALHFTLKVGDASYAVVAYLPPDVKDPREVRQLLGSFEQPGLSGLAILNRGVKLDREPEDGLGPYRKAEDVSDPEKHARRLEDIMGDYKDQSVAFGAGAELLDIALTGGEAKDADLTAKADAFVKLAEPFGPEAKRQADVLVAEELLRNMKAALAAPYAEKARELLKDSDSDETKLRVHKAAADALRKADKADKAKGDEAEIAKLEEKADKQYLDNLSKQTNLKPPFPAKEAKTDQPVLVELFTGSQSPTASASELAFDALRDTYTPQQAVFVEYHVDIPDPDPLANADAEARRKYYGAIATPWVLINGKAVKSPPVGGADKAQAAYAAIAKAIDDALDAAAKAKPAAKIQLDAKRKGDAVTIGGEVSDVAKADDLVLHVVLVEDAVRYQGQSGVRLHYQVARALPGGADGSPVKEGTTKIDLPVKLGDVAKAANAYLDMEMYTGPDRPLDLKKLKAVAFLQNAKTQEVLQVTQVEVPEEAAPAPDKDKKTDKDEKKTDKDK